MTQFTRNWWDIKFNFWLLCLPIIAVYFIPRTHFSLPHFHILPLVLFLISAILTLQGVVHLFLTLYAYNDPDEIARHTSPVSYLPPKLSFTALVPIFHESEIIASTIQAFSNLNYPSYLFETLIICRDDDPKTISAVQSTLSLLNKPSFKLIVCPEPHTGKPRQLNFALPLVKNNIVAVFDAEDCLHPDTYHIINTVFQRDSADVIQSGVQLLNYSDSWFSSLNVLEYFFWFKSALHFFAKHSVVPLGGNTVFFKRHWLTAIDGWNEQSLTEDAEVGLRVSLLGAKIITLYDSRHATTESTPPTLSSFIRQRTRWNQGFLQIFASGLWLDFPKIGQKILAAYLLILPEILALTFVFLPLSTAATLWAKQPLPLTLFTFVPLCLLLLQFVIAHIGLYLFSRDYGKPFPWRTHLRLVISFIPYLIVLGASAARAVVRQLTGKTTWEKTPHLAPTHDHYSKNYI